MLSSASFRISLDALGDGIAGGYRSPSGASYHADGGFVDAYAPPPSVPDPGAATPDRER